MSKKHKQRFYIESDGRNNHRIIDEDMNRIIGAREVVSTTNSCTASTVCDALNFQHDWNWHKEGKYPFDIDRLTIEVYRDLLKEYEVDGYKEGYIVWVEDFMRLQSEGKLQYKYIESISRVMIQIETLNHLLAG